MTGTVLAVCVVHADVPFGRRAVVHSGIDKRPVDGPAGSGACGTTSTRVDVHELGIGGDHCRDTKFHGGLDQAVYAYDEAEASTGPASSGCRFRRVDSARTCGPPVFR